MPQNIPSDEPFNPESQELLVESFFTKPAPDRKLPEEGVIPQAAHALIHVRDDARRGSGQEPGHLRHDLDGP